MAFAPIAQKARELTAKLGLTSDLSMIERAWGIEIGSLQDVARIAALDNGGLVVETDSNVVMQEISLRRRELVRKLNRHLRVPLIRHIVVRLSGSYGN